jgi:hypothetical protein
MLHAQQYHHDYTHYIGSNDYLERADFIVQSSKNRMLARGECRVSASAACFFSALLR